MDHISSSTCRDSTMLDPTASLHSSPVSITRDQAENVIRKLLPGHDQTIVSKLSDIRSKGYSFSSTTRTYICDLTHATDKSGSPISSCFLTISPATPSSEDYHPNSLPVVHQLLSQIRTKTDVPLKESILDTSLSFIPYHLLLSDTSPTTSDCLISIADARALGIFSERTNILIDLELGKLLGQLHTNVQNDWYGLPSLKEPSSPSYSWQETFTFLLEGLLSRFETGSIQIDFTIPYEKIRLAHSRAIGFSLFDDVEVPSMIWVTGSEHDVFIVKPDPNNGGDKLQFELAAILPVATHTLWGDPLLESFFIPPKPSKAMAEGYIGAGGGALTIFPRQNTKRLWYDLFLTLLVLYEIRTFGSEYEEMNEKREWCKEKILASAEALKDAPCF